MTTTAPTRIQRRRTKGWRAPAGAIYVGRGTRYGNPSRLVHGDNGWRVEHETGAPVGTFPTAEDARRFAADAYRHHLRQHPELLAAAREELAGAHLSCWCPLPRHGEPDHCHAAVLLAVVNGDEL